MCNLYSHTKGQQTILEASRAMIDRTGNLPSQPGIFPDYAAPIVRNTAEGRDPTMARWGMPLSSKALFDAAKLRACKLEAKGMSSLSTFGARLEFTASFGRSAARGHGR